MFQPFVQCKVRKTIYHLERHAKGENKFMKIMQKPRRLHAILQAQTKDLESLIDVA